MARAAVRRWQYLTGYSQATPRSYKVRYEADEMIHLFEGWAPLIDNGMEPRTYVAGDTFLKEAGLDGIWTTEETVSKLFAIRPK